MNSRQIVGGQIFAREQNKRRLRDQHDRREISRRIIKRGLVERLIGGVRAHIAEHELVAVRRSFRYAGAAGHAAGAADVFDNDLLAEQLGKARSKDPSDRIGRPTGGERHDHGHRSGRPVLRERRRNRYEGADRNCSDVKQPSHSHLNTRPHDAPLFLSLSRRQTSAAKARSATARPPAS